MTIRRWWLLTGLAMLVAMASSDRVWGQGYPPPPAGPGMAPMAPQPGYPQPMAALPPAPSGPAPGMMAPGGYPYAPPAYAGAPMPGGAYGPPGGMTGGMMPQMMPAMGPMAGPVMAPEGACPYCGGQGCSYCLQTGADDFDVRILRWILPYSEGGICEQRFYNIFADALYMKREDVSRRVDFTSDGVAGPIVLSSDSLDFSDEIGIRVGGAIQIGAGKTIETAYMGMFDHDSRAQVTSAGNLYSAMSNFGVAPPGGFDDTDASDLQSIAYGTTFDTVELSIRQRWVAPNCRIQGSYLYGIRYFQLEEGFLYQTLDAPDFMNYSVDTYNALTGFQVGGDLWVTIIPGLRLGAEAKVGLYGKRSKQFTVIDAGSLVNPVRESVSETGVAFVGEANLMAIWRISHRWTFRAGWEFLYVDSVALAIENFNSGPPFVVGQRTPFINSNGDAFYHGGYIGFEWMW